MSKKLLQIDSDCVPVIQVPKDNTNPILVNNAGVIVQGAESVQLTVILQHEQVHNSKPKTPKSISPESLSQLKEAIRARYLSSSHISQLFTTGEFPISDLFVNLAIINEIEQKKSEKTELKKSNDEMHHDTRIRTYENIHSISKSKKLIEPKELFTSKSPDTSQSKISRVLVIGRAGIGKSVFSQFLAYQWATNQLWDKNFEFVFKINLRNLTNLPNISMCSSNAILHECIDEHYLDTIEPELINALLRDDKYYGKILFILDGIDEVAQHLNERMKSTHEQTPISTLLNELIFKNNHTLLLTSRPHYTEQINYLFRDLKHAQRLEIIGFTHSNVKIYIKKFFSSINKKKFSKQLIRSISRNPNIWGIGHIPVLLELICNLWLNHRNESSFKSMTMTKLYQDAFLWILRRHAQKFLRLQSYANITIQQFENFSKYGNKIKFLEELAWNAIERPHNNILFRGNYLTRFIEKYRERDEENFENDIILQNNFLKEIDQLGILLHTGKNRSYLDDEYYFIHLTFQEFFAARYWGRLFLSNETEAFQVAIEYFKQHQYDARFEIIWWFVSGILTNYPDKQELFFKILLNQKRDIANIKFFSQLVRCYNEAKGNLLNILQNESVQKIIIQSRENILYNIRMNISLNVNFFSELIIEDVFTNQALNEISQCIFVSQQPNICIIPELNSLTRTKFNSANYRLFSIVSYLSSISAYNENTFITICKLIAAINFTLVDEYHPCSFFYLTLTGICMKFLTKISKYAYIKLTTTTLNCLLQAYLSSTLDNDIFLNIVKRVNYESQVLKHIISYILDQSQNLTEEREKLYFYIQVIKNCDVTALEHELYFSFINKIYMMIIASEPETPKHLKMIWNTLYHKTRNLDTNYEHIYQLIILSSAKQFHGAITRKTKPKEIRNLIRWLNMASTNPELDVRQKVPCIITALHRYYIPKQYVTELASILITLAGDSNETVSYSACTELRNFPWGNVEENKRITLLFSSNLSNILLKNYDIFTVNNYFPYWMYDRLRDKYKDQKRIYSLIFLLDTQICTFICEALSVLKEINSHTLRSLPLYLKTELIFSLTAAHEERCLATHDHNYEVYKKLHHIEKLLKSDSLKSSTTDSMNKNPLVKVKTTNSYKKLPCIDNNSLDKTKFIADTVRLINTLSHIQLINPMNINNDTSDILCLLFNFHEKPNTSPHLNGLFMAEKSSLYLIVGSSDKYLSAGLTLSLTPLIAHIQWENVRGIDQQRIFNQLFKHYHFNRISKEKVAVAFKELNWRRIEQITYRWLINKLITMSNYNHCLNIHPIMLLSYMNLELLNEDSTRVILRHIYSVTDYFSQKRKILKHYSNTEHEYTLNYMAQIISKLDWCVINKTDQITLISTLVELMQTKYSKVINKHFKDINWNDLDEGALLYLIKQLKIRVCTEEHHYFGEYLLLLIDFSQLAMEYKLRTITYFIKLYNEYIFICSDRLSYNIALEENGILTPNELFTLVDISNFNHGVLASIINFLIIGLTHENSSICYNFRLEKILPFLMKCDSLPPHELNKLLLEAYKIESYFLSTEIYDFLLSINWQLLDENTQQSLLKKLVKKLATNIPKKSNDPQPIHHLLENLPWDSMCQSAKSTCLLSLTTYINKKLMKKVTTFKTTQYYKLLLFFKSLVELFPLNVFLYIIENFSTQFPFLLYLYCVDNSRLLLIDTDTHVLKFQDRKNEIHHFEIIPGDIWHKLSNHTDKVGISKFSFFHRECWKSRYDKSKIFNEDTSTSFESSGTSEDDEIGFFKEKLHFSGYTCLLEFEKRTCTEFIITITDNSQAVCVEIINNMLEVLQTYIMARSEHVCLDYKFSNNSLIIQASESEIAWLEKALYDNSYSISDALEKSFRFPSFSGITSCSIF